MRIKRSIQLGIASLVALLVIQIVTFKLTAMQKLEHELLTDDFNPHTFGMTSIDSAFVRDFFVSDCASGPETFYSHNLTNKEIGLRKKLNVNFIEFQDPGEYVWTSPAQCNYPLVYLTWTYRTNSLKPAEWFTAVQMEEILINGQNQHKRVTEYRWVLFFWTKSLERIESYKT